MKDVAGSLGEAVIEIGADTSRFRSEVDSGVQSALAKASKSVQNVGKKMTSAGTKLTAGVTAPIVGIGVASLRTAAQFEQTMNVLQANSNATAKDMESLDVLAKQLGADTVFSANEAADAMLELSKGGFTPAQISAGGVQATMSLAATESMALADAATVVSNNMNAFGLSAAEATQIADSLAAGSAASTASVNSLAEGMSNVGGTARNFGLDLQETVGVLAAFDQNAVRGAEGGTALNSLLTKLSNPTTKAKKALRAYEIELVNANGSFKNITEIAGEFERGLGGLTQAEKAKAVTTIAGTYGQRALNALMKEGEEGIKGYIDQTREQGVAQKLANARMSGTAGAMERMSGALETAGLVIGEAIAPTVNKVADAIALMADKFTTLSPRVQQIVVVFAAAAAALGPLLVVSGMVVSAIGSLGVVFAGLSVAAVAPVVAIAALVAGIGVLLYKSEDARATISKAFSEISGAVMPAVSEIGDIIRGTLLPAFSAMWPVIQKVGEILLKVFAGAVVGAIKGLVKIVTGAFKVIGGVVNVVAGLLTGDWSRMWEGMKSIMSGLLQAILGAIQVWWNVSILGFFRRGFAFLTKGLWVGLWKSLRSLATSGFTAITGAIRAGASGAVQMFRNLIRGILTAFRNIFSSSLKAVRGGWGKIRGAFVNAFGALRGAVGKGFAAIGKGISSAFRSIVSTAGRGVSSVVKAISALPSKLLKLSGRMKGVGKAIIDAFVEGMKNASGIISGIAGNVWNTVKGMINGAIDKINSALEFKISIPGPDIHINPPNIPRLATGTVAAAGGRYLVGEHGPELVELPRGSKVTNAAATRAAADRPARGNGMPRKMVLRIGARDFIAYVEEIADDRIDAADSLGWQGA